MLVEGKVLGAWRVRRLRAADPGAGVQFQRRRCPSFVPLTEETPAGVRVSTGGVFKLTGRATGITRKLKSELNHVYVTLQSVIRDIVVKIVGHKLHLGDLHAVGSQDEICQIRKV